MQLVMVYILFPLTQGPTLMPLGIEAVLSRFLGWTKAVPICLVLTLAECATRRRPLPLRLDWQGAPLPGPGAEDPRDGDEPSGLTPRETDPTSPRVTELVLTTTSNRGSRARAGADEDVRDHRPAAGRRRLARGRAVHRARRGPPVRRETRLVLDPKMLEDKAPGDYGEVLGGPSSATSARRLQAGPGAGRRRAPRPAVRRGRGAAAPPLGAAGRAARRRLDSAGARPAHAVRPPPAQRHRPPLPADRPARPAGADRGRQPDPARAMAADAVRRRGDGPRRPARRSARSPPTSWPGRGRDRPADARRAVCGAITGRPYTLLHVVAHGRFKADDGEPTVFLSTPEGTVARRARGRPDRRGSSQLRRAPAACPHLAFLSTCEGAAPEAEGVLGGLGQRLVRELGMPAVVAMTERSRSRRQSRLGVGVLRARSAGTGRSTWRWPSRTPGSPGVRTSRCRCRCCSAAWRAGRCSACAPDGAPVRWRDRPRPGTAGGPAARPRPGPARTLPIGTRRPCAACSGPTPSNRLASDGPTASGRWPESTSSASRRLELTSRRWPTTRSRRPATGRCPFRGLEAFNPFRPRKAR